MHYWFWQLVTREEENILLPKKFEKCHEVAATVVVSKV